MPRADDKLRLLFNAIILASSILIILFLTIAWQVVDFSAILSYILSTLVTLLLFHQLKVRLLKGNTSHTEEPIEMRFPLDLRKSQTFLLFLVVALVMATPLIILFLVPRLWLVILDGIVSGATLSEIVLYLHRNRINHMSRYI
jgi:hypothetical protein